MAVWQQRVPVSAACAGSRARGRICPSHSTCGTPPGCRARFRLPGMQDGVAAGDASGGPGGGRGLHCAGSLGGGGGACAAEGAGRVGGSLPGGYGKNGTRPFSEGHSGRGPGQGQERKLPAG